MIKLNFPGVASSEKAEGERTELQGLFDKLQSALTQSQVPEPAIELVGLLIEGGYMLGMKERAAQAQADVHSTLDTIMRGLKK